MDDKGERGICDGEESTESGNNSNASFKNPVTKTSENSNNLTLGTQASNPEICPTSKQKFKNWEPKPELMKQLTGMGISKTAAKKALFYTGNNSAEMAISWIFEYPDADLETSLEKEAEKDSDTVFKDVYKMVFVVNSSLEMGVGKTCAQVAHAALGMHYLLLQDENEYGYHIIKWSEFGETKIVLKGDSTHHLIDLEKKALELGLPTYLVQDAGKTQVPEGSITVLCIFGRLDLVDKVTGSLRLL